MRTLHVGLRVNDRARSVAYYSLLGYQVVGEVPETPIGHLTMLKLPRDPFVSLHEFVSRSALQRMVTESEVASAVIAVLNMPGLTGADIDLSAGMVAR